MFGTPGAMLPSSELTLSKRQRHPIQFEITQNIF